MADFTPKFLPGRSWTSQASATITAGQLVKVSGSGTVNVATANTIAVGVAAFDASSGDKVTLYTGGIAVLAASGSITAGDIVVTAAAGAVSTLAAVTTPTAADVTNTRAIVGVALSDAASNLVTVRFL
jgi:hypothetical protein